MRFNASLLRACCQEGDARDYAQNSNRGDDPVDAAGCLLLRSCMTAKFKTTVAMQNQHRRFHARCTPISQHHITSPCERALFGAGAIVPPARSATSACLVGIHAKVPEVHDGQVGSGDELAQVAVRHLLDVLYDLVRRRLRAVAVVPGEVEQR